jgi:hypothetical protein
MPLEHAHKPGQFDPGHCRDCARETDLLDHLLACATTGASVQVHRAVGPPRPPVRYLGAVAGWEEHPAGRHRPAHPLISGAAVCCGAPDARRDPRQRCPGPPAVGCTDPCWSDTKGTTMQPPTQHRSVTLAVLPVDIAPVTLTATGHCRYAGQVRGPARTQPVPHAAGTRGAATHGGGMGRGRGPGRWGP